MAELFTGIIMAMGGGGGAAAGGAAAAAGAGAAAGGFSWAGLASLGATVVGGLASIASGNAQGAALEAQARDENFRAVQETVNGRQEALQAMKKLNQDLANVSVAGYASGLAPQGSIEAAQNAAIEAGEFNITMSRTNAQMAAASRRQNSYQLRQEARAARRAGMFGAIQGGLSAFGRQTARG